MHERRGDLEFGIKEKDLGIKGDLEFGIKGKDLGIKGDPGGIKGSEGSLGGRTKGYGGDVGDKSCRGPYAGKGEWPQVLQEVRLRCALARLVGEANKEGSWRRDGGAGNAGSLAIQGLIIVHAAESASFLSRESCVSKA